MNCWCVFYKLLHGRPVWVFYRLLLLLLLFLVLILPLLPHPHRRPMSPRIMFVRRHRRDAAVAVAPAASAPIHRGFDLFTVQMAISLMCVCVDT